MLRRIASSVLALAMIAGPCWGQNQPLNSARFGDLAERAAATKFNPVNPASTAERDAARAGLRVELEQAEAVLNALGQVKADSWKRYLLWSELAAAKAADAAQPLNATTTAQVIANIQAAQGSLARPEYARFRQALNQLEQALEKYDDAGSAPAAPLAPEEFTRRLEALAAQLKVFADSRMSPPDAKSEDAQQKDERNKTAGDAALAIGRTLAWLEANRQAPELVAAIRQEFGRPNFLGYTSHRFAATNVARQIDQVMPVSDNILGTSLHGTARMVGSTSLVLNENPHLASMNVVLSGNAWSNSMGYNGPVTIHTTGATSISGQKLVTMNAEGLRAYNAQAACRTNSKIHDICARLGIVERIAWKKAGQQKGQAEQIGSQHAAARVAGQLNQEVGGPVAAQNKRYQEKVRGPLLERGAFPEDVAFSSTRERLLLRMRQDSPQMLAAPDEPPGFTRDHDLASRTHESAITNFGEALLAGHVLKDVEIEKRMREDLEIDVPEDLQTGEDKEPWAIRFSAEQPARARFSGGTVWMAIRADEFFRGEQSRGGDYISRVKELIEISATYQIEKTDSGVTLRRTGDVVIRFPNRANPDVWTFRDTANFNVLRIKFRNLFKDEFVGTGLEFKGPLAKAGRLSLQEIQADNAWLVLGWQMPAIDAAAANSAEE